MVRVTKILVAVFLTGLIVALNTNAISSDVHRSFYQVQNLSCGYCLGKIDSALRTLEGYIGMAANFEKELIAVDHKINLIESEIAGAMKSIGYPAKICQFDTAQNQIIISESRGWKKPSNGLLNRILKIIIR